jgi:predicted phage baseplate assembly protein
VRRWLLEQALEGALAPSRHDVDTWLPRFDLLASTGDNRHFVVEMTDDRRATLRFGDDDLGRRPEAVSRFRARYRIGNGAVGNVGAEAISYVVHAGGLLEGLTLRPRNPLPARGGTSPESLDQARRLAPAAIGHDLARAVIAQDYADLAARDFSVQLQGAAADLTWTGSWYEAYVGLDPLGREEAATELREAVEARLERYRRIGHGLRVAEARYVPLDITVAVCVESRHLRGHVLAELENAFSAGLRADGHPGFFHPDNLRFRSSVDVSEIVAVAQQIEGVLWVAVTKLERTGEGAGGEVDAGTLQVGPLEVARVDSRRGFPEFGSITFDLEGGR